MERVLITGSNRGLGLEMVRQYTESGAQVFATARQPEQADELQQLARQYADQIAIMALDVADQAQLEQVTHQVAGLVDGLDILINNAGINPRSLQSFEAITRETMLEVFDVNAVSALMMVKALVGLLRNGNNPRIANISSQVGSMEWKASGGSYAYAVSKAALNMVTRCLAGDLRSDGIITVTFHPGWAQTDMGGQGAPLSV